MWLNSFDTDTVSRQKVGQGLYKNTESGEECDRSGSNALQMRCFMQGYLDLDHRKVP